MSSNTGGADVARCTYLFFDSCRQGRRGLQMRLRVYICHGQHRRAVVCLHKQQHIGFIYSCLHLQVLPGAIPDSAQDAGGKLALGLLTHQIVLRLLNASQNAKADQSVSLSKKAAALGSESEDVIADRGTKDSSPALKDASKMILSAQQSDHMAGLWQCLEVLHHCVYAV